MECTLKNPAQFRMQRTAEGASLTTVSAVSAPLDGYLLPQSTAPPMRRCTSSPFALLVAVRGRSRASVARRVAPTLRSNCTPRRRWPRSPPPAASAASSSQSCWRTSASLHAAAARARH
eukprot:scaffold13162_cov82-Isochrysis_galbana.AAC.2